jgi:superfamily I DNA/RNA helicase
VSCCCSQGRLKSGLDIIAELKGAAAPDFAKMNEQSAARLASVFDRYQAQLRWQRLLDFDDLLHHCLALVHSNEQVSTGPELTHVTV